ncbi:hypothetical protein NQ317_005492 [Molorchus minor]|uniref:Sodium/calcium exchanger membrane region domain-containing protein n=1 Tax=Molorchus minor TaxID=1323400 RepID=A0ABQ9JUY8_9CUCU|nr:hypothetical protein NQ317_005492 [Molorchus minor]
MLKRPVTILASGSLFNIPDAVLGLSFLAAGSGLPESISMAIISMRGEGAFGVSNALGANTMNILFSLGMPWFFKTITQGTSSKSFIQIQSGSIEYTILALIGVVAVLYVTLYLKKFRLVCVVMAILSEMVFFNNSICLSLFKTYFKQVRQGWKTRIHTSDKNSYILYERLLICLLKHQGPMYLFSVPNIHISSYITQRILDFVKFTLHEMRQVFMAAREL